MVGVGLSLGDCLAVWCDACLWGWVWVVGWDFGLVVGWVGSRLVRVGFCEFFGGVVCWFGCGDVVLDCCWVWLGWIWVGGVGV